jgi:Cft2 family RNA processing exonuclease
MVTWALNCVNKEIIPVFQVYSTGKAQEVNKIFNTFTKLPVVVTPSIAKVNKAYEKNNIALSYCCSNTDEGQALLNKKHCVFLSSKFSNDLPKNSFLTAAATGWAYTSWTNKYDAAFPLSGHADFKQLVNYAKNVNPKKVLTLHGFKDEFAAYLTKNVGINAQPITASMQKQLFEYV